MTRSQNKGFVFPLNFTAVYTLYSDKNNFGASVGWPGP